MYTPPVLSFLDHQQHSRTMTTDQTVSAGAPPSLATEAVLVPSEPVPEGARPVRGVDFDRYRGRDITVADLVGHMGSMGFQATAVADAVRIINEMVRSCCFPFFSFFPLPGSMSRSIYTADVDRDSARTGTPRPASARPSSSDTRPTSSRPACARRCASSSSTATSPPSSPPPAASRRT